MTNNVTVGLHQQAEFRETIVLHGGWGDFADEAHERQTCGRKRTSVALNLERGLIGIVAISTRIVGMAHYQCFASLVPKGDFENAGRGAGSILVTLDDFRPNAVVEMGKDLQNALLRSTVAPSAEIHPRPGVWEHKTSEGVVVILREAKIGHPHRCIIPCVECFQLFFAPLLSLSPCQQHSPSQFVVPLQILFQNHSFLLMSIKLCVLPFVCPLLISI